MHWWWAAAEADGAKVKCLTRYNPSYVKRRPCGMSSSTTWVRVRVRVRVEGCTTDARWARGGVLYVHSEFQARSSTLGS